MAKTVREVNLSTREARRRLAARGKPYWRFMDHGRHLGYRKTREGGSWLARQYLGQGKYEEARLGTADDQTNADGATVLTHSQAQGKARDWFTNASDALAGSAPATPYTVGMALDDYMEWFRQHRKSPKDTQRSIDAHIRPTFGATVASQLTPAMIREWHAKLADAPARLRTRKNEKQKYRDEAVGGDAKRARKATANRILTILKAALNHAFSEGKIISDEAWRRVRPFREAETARVRYLGKDECRRLLNAAKPDLRRLINGALLTGCRYGELARLQVADYCADAGSLLIREAKSGKARHIPLDAEARKFFAGLTAGRSPTDILFVRKNGKPWGKAHQARPLATACTAARIEPAPNFHCLRHTWASHRVMAGAPLMVVSTVLGHSDTRMVERHYGHLAPSYIRDAIERTAFGLGTDAEDSKIAPLKPSAPVA